MEAPLIQTTTVALGYWIMMDTRNLLGAGNVFVFETVSRGFQAWPGRLWTSEFPVSQVLGIETFTHRGCYEWTQGLMHARQALSQLSYILTLELAMLWIILFCFPILASVSTVHSHGAHTYTQASKDSNINHAFKKKWNKSFTKDTHDVIPCVWTIHNKDREENDCLGLRVLGEHEPWRKQGINDSYKHSMSF